VETGKHPVSNGIFIGLLLPVIVAVIIGYPVFLFIYSARKKRGVVESWSRG
jgi:hypothetical protein